MNKEAPLSKKPSETPEKKTQPLDSLKTKEEKGMKEETVSSPTSLDPKFDALKTPLSIFKNDGHLAKPHYLLIFSVCFVVLAMIVGVNTYQISHLKNHAQLIDTWLEKSPTKREITDTIIPLLNRLQILEQHTEKLSTMVEAPRPSSPLASSPENEKIFQTFPLGPQQLAQIEASLNLPLREPHTLGTEKIHQSFLRIKAFLYAHDLRFILAHPLSQPNAHLLAFEKLEHTLSSLLSLEHTTTLQTSLDLLRLKLKDIGEFQNLYQFPGNGPIQNQALTAESTPHLEYPRPLAPMTDVASSSFLERLYDAAYHLWHHIHLWTVNNSSWIKKYFSLQKNDQTMLPLTIKDAIVKALEGHDLDTAHHHADIYLRQLPSKSEAEAEHHQQWQIWTKHILARLHVEKALMALQQSLMEGIAP